MSSDLPDEAHRSRDVTEPGGPRTCDRIFELISASIDGEATPSEQRAVDDHLAMCASCRLLADRMTSVERRLRLSLAEPVPDLRIPILARSRPPALGRSGWVRPALVWVSIVLVVQNVMALVGGRLDGADVHTARHVGAFGVSLAIGYLYVAWKPHRAHGLVPFAGALVAAMLANAVIDTVGGNRTVLAESRHLAEIAGFLLVWSIAGSPLPAYLRRRRSRSAPTH